MQVSHKSLQIVVTAIAQGISTGWELLYNIIVYAVLQCVISTRLHNQSFHRCKQTSHTVIIFVCEIIIIIGDRYYKAVLFSWLTHSVYSSSKATSSNEVKA